MITTIETMYTVKGQVYVRMDIYTSYRNGTRHEYRYMPISPIYVYNVQGTYMGLDKKIVEILTKRKKHLILKKKT